MVKVDGPVLVFSDLDAQDTVEEAEYQEIQKYPSTPFEVRPYILFSFHLLIYVPRWRYIVVTPNSTSRKQSGPSNATTKPH